MTSSAFASAFFAADNPLIGDMPPNSDLSNTVHRLTTNLEAELTHRGGTDKSGSDGDRGRRVASRFLREASAAFARNRPVLEALRSAID